MALSTTILACPKVTLAAVILIMPIAGIACLGASLSAEASPEKCLRIGLPEKIDSLNPCVGNTAAADVFYSLVYDCLQCAGSDLGSEPNIALEWEVVENFEPRGSVWDYHITPNARWHDDSPLTADDVVFTLNHHALNHSQFYLCQPYSYFMNHSEKVDDLTARVFFSDRATGDPKPVAFADSLFIPVLPKHLLWNLSSANLAFNWEGVFDDSDPPVVGSGPFMATEDIFQEYLQGDKITLVKSPYHHWSVDRGVEIRYDKIELMFYDNASEIKAALMSGEIDIAKLPGEEFLEVRDLVFGDDIQNVEVYDGPANRFTYIGINVNNMGPNPSRLDPVIRQAMAMATNMTYIVENPYLGLADEGSTLIPPVNERWHYNLTEEETYDYDIDAAGALLENSGYRYTPESPSVRVCTADSYAVQQGLVPENTPLRYDLVVRQEYPEEKGIAQYLESEWAMIGIGLVYSIMTEAGFSPVYCPFYWDLWLWDCPLNADPNYILWAQSKCAWNSWSDNQYYSAAYEENYSGFVETLDDDMREEYARNCQKIHYEDVGYLVLASMRQSFAWRTDNYTGWGDWEAEPGRAIDIAWAGSALYFDLEPVEEDNTTLIAIAVVTVGVAAAVTVAVVYFRKRART